MRERHTPTLQLKDAKTDSNGIFEGYAATFNGPVDSYGDVIAPGAFARSLKQHIANDTMPAMLWAHNLKEPIGKWLDVSEDRYGLKVTGRFTLGTQRGAEAHALAKDGALGMSIGYELVDMIQDGKVNLLKQVNLVEISVVAVPANHAARITSVKSLPNNVRDFERFLRDDVGYSRSEARRIATRGWSSPLGQQDNDGLKSELALAIRTLSTLTKG
ncbi:HK97 family phage prohead protease [Noviherbaspirillum malthae]|uniref:HK97 family phage prohead protease n=1 Tax=Noviherbaspirillum malthae TaxID=1260987 RepID=UPI0018909CDC|nr:HK97 family phage prohead protease [Noviherbaspirillum malthae]